MVACGAQCHGPCCHDVTLITVHVQCPSTATLAWSTPKLGAQQHQYQEHQKQLDAVSTSQVSV